MVDRRRFLSLRQRRVVPLSQSVWERNQRRQDVWCECRVNVGHQVDWLAADALQAFCQSQVDKQRYRLREGHQEIDITVSPGRSRNDAAEKIRLNEAIIT